MISNNNYINNVDQYKIIKGIILSDFTEILYELQKHGGKFIIHQQSEQWLKL